MELSKDLWRKSKMSKMLIIRNNGQYGVNYSTPCHYKKDEKDETYWLSVQFKRNEEPKFYNGNKVNIEVEKFFLSAFPSKDGLKPKMVIMEYSQETEQVEQPAEQYSTFNVQSDDLPF